MFDITFLGTGSAMPTKERNVSSIFVRHNGLGILLDCGEGTQRQMVLAGISRADIDIIILTHWHGDHIGGLLPMLQTIGNSKEKQVSIYGPLGTKEYMKHLLHSCSFESAPDIVVHEIDAKEPSIFFENSDLRFDAVNVIHAIPCIALSIVEKERINIDKEKMAAQGLGDGPHCKQLKAGKDVVVGKKKYRAADLTYKVAATKLVYVTDTIFCKSAVELARNADLLICEATFVEEQRDRAKESKHMTSSDAARLANDADAKRLLLTHFSQRYTSSDATLTQARTIFKKTECAHDLMNVKL